MTSPQRSVETEVLTKLVTFLTASGLLKNFIELKLLFGGVDVAYLEDDGTIYVSRFNECKRVIQFLYEQKEQYQEKASQIIINNMIKEWPNVISYILMTIDSSGQNQEN